MSARGLVTDADDLARRDLQAVVDAGVMSAEATPVAGGSTYAFVVPAGGKVEIVDRDTDLYRDRPRRLKGTTVVRSEASLITLAEALGRTHVGEAGDGHAIRVYADAVNRTVEAVLNDDIDASTPGWRDRRVRLDLVHTPEWQRWAAKNGTLMTQQAFAEHVEECLEDIREPTAADMLEIAQTLEAKTDVAFRSSVRLTSGQRQFTYSEDTEARAGSGGTLEIPETFVLGLTPWQGREAKPFRVEARLRYRVGPSGLQLGYRLIDVERVLRTAFEQDVVGPISEAGLTVINGTP